MDRVAHQDEHPAGPRDHRKVLSEIRSRMPDGMRRMFDVGRLVERTVQCLDEFEHWKAREAIGQRPESVDRPNSPTAEQDDRMLDETLDALDERGVRRKKLVRYLFGVTDRKATIDEIVRDLYAVNLKDSRVQRVKQARRAARKLVNRAIEDAGKLKTPLTLTKSKNLVGIEYRTTEGQNLDVE